MGVDTEPVSQAEANFKEDLTRRLFSDCYFHKRFRDGAKNQFMIGWTWLYPFWNKKNKLGGSKGTFDLSVLNPFTTRVKYKANDYEMIESFVTFQRMSQAEILKRYNLEALPDSEDTFVPKTFQAQDDGMTTVFFRYGENDIRVVINSREVEKISHGLGFCPLVQVNNIIVPNDIHGHSEIERWKEIAQEINALLSGASEIARDLAYPPILEYNNALGGRKVAKWRGMQIPVKRSDRGEAIQFMQQTAQIVPLIKQTELLIELFHFVALMPKAAGGVFSANVTSGFQAKLAMQPATLTTDSRKIDWEWAIKQLVKMAFKILKKNNPEALKIKSGKKEIEISDVYDHEMQIVWPTNLPIDIAREIQNLVLGVQNNLTSLHQAIDRYNVLLGFGSTEDTVKFLKQEATDPELGPERALKVQEVKQKVEELLNGLDQMNEKLNAMRGQMNQGENPLPESLAENARQNNPTNLTRSATSPLPEEQRNYPESGREAVVPESTGGVMIPPIRTRKRKKK
jgi:hypothetical protein